MSLDYLGGGANRRRRYFPPRGPMARFPGGNSSEFRLCSAALYRRLPLRSPRRRSFCLSAPGPPLAGDLFLPRARFLHAAHVVFAFAIFHSLTFRRRGPNKLSGKLLPLTLREGLIG